MNFKVYRHVLSQYPALWPCLIYEAASFIFSPVVYQPHETSTRTSFLTTYTEMCAPALSYAYTLQTADCYHYNTGMFDEQYCQQVWKKGNKRVGDWDIVGGAPSLFPLTLINRDHTLRQKHSVSFILFYPLFFLGCRRREHLK